jgi:hypothetical protein
MDVAAFLIQLGQALSRAATTSRELEAIELQADGHDVSIRVRHVPHDKFYPPLAVILGEIGRTCHEQGVVVGQLSRISFLPDEVRVELVGDVYQPGGVYRYPIETTLGAPTPVPTPLHAVSGTLGSSIATPMNPDTPQAAQASR